MKKKILHFVKDKNKKSYLQIIKESIQLFIEDKKFPKHYFSRAFYHNNNPFNYRDFMSMDTYNKILRSKNFENPSLESLLYNKLSFDIFCSNKKIPTPKTVSHNFNNKFFYNNEIIEISTIEEFKNYFLSILENSATKGLFLKEISGCQGVGTHVVKKSTSLNKFSIIYNDLIKSSYIHQEFITQHKEINDIFPKTINTLRLETYYDKNGEIHFLGSFIRFGSGNSIVDNVSSGGMFIPVDIDNGKLFEQGYLSKYEFFKKCYKHPDTGFEFKNFQIPYFEESKDEVIKATKLLPKSIIGWDVAITPNGPIILEGNFIPALLLGEYSYLGYKNLPIFKEIIEEAIK